MPYIHTLESEMDLECWSEDWGIPSTDPECLKIMTFAKFSGAPLNLKPTNNPFWTPTGSLPVFRHDVAGVVLTDFPNIAKHLREGNYSADYNLSEKQLAESRAFCQMIEEKLGPAIKYLMWVDTRNQLEVTRPWFGSHLPFPLGLYYPQKFEAAACRLIESLFCVQDGDEIGPESLVETSVYKGAEECLTCLSNRLGDQPFMFGRSPSSLDAVLYAYLAPLIKAPWPSAGLQNYVKNCENLVKFTSRVSINYFPKVVKAWEASSSSNDKPSSSESKKDESKTEKSKTEPDTSWPHEGRDKILAGCVASTAMLGYAYGSGFLDIVKRIEIRWGEEEEGEYEEEQ